MQSDTLFWCFKSPPFYGEGVAIMHSVNGKKEVSLSIFTPDCKNLLKESCLMNIDKAGFLWVIMPTYFSLGWIDTPGTEQITGQHPGMCRLKVYQCGDLMVTEAVFSHGCHRVAVVTSVRYMFWRFLISCVGGHGCVILRFLTSTSTVECVEIQH